MSRLRVAVVGAGHLGRIHARLLAALPEVELTAVVDTVPRQAEQVAAQHGVAALRDYRRVVPLADAVVVATPTVTHYAVGMDLLRAGLHLFVEKPLAPTVVEAQALVAAAAARGRVLQVGHVERFNPAFTSAAPLVGRPQYLAAERTSGYTFRSTDIGVVLDLMIHDIDLALALAQSRVERIDALGFSIFGKHEDVAQARLTFANGCVANLTASRASYVAGRRMQVFGDAGFAALDFAAPAAKIVRPGARLLHREIDVERLSPEEQAAMRDRLFVEHLPCEELALPPRNAIQDELRDFAASIAMNCAPTIDGRQGLEAVAVAERVLAEIAAHRWNTDVGRHRGAFAPLVAERPLPATNLPHRRNAA